MSTTETQLAPSSDIGRLGVMHLKRYWEKCRLRKSGKLAQDSLLEEWNTDTRLLAALGLGLEQAVRYLYLTSPGFDEFEDWVLSINGGQLDQENVEEFNRSFANTVIKNATEENIANVLNAADLKYWDENGYIILREAVSKPDCESTIDLICDFIGIKKDEPGTWYHPHPSRQGIMVQLFQHPLLEKNRHAQKIRSAYEQLWERKDIWVNTDRVGFNPPETTTWKFPGPGLHWDVSLALPIPFGLQGILYLTDTAANQGAFTLVPGFHRRIESWIKHLPPGTNPRNEDLHALGSTPIVANAGDFIIWHQALPHGSSPNRSLLPRFVQYINYAPPEPEIRDIWI